MVYKISKMKQDEFEVLNHESEVCKFYSQKTILITGAAGFLGEFILEILLRCCPNILRIYILLRRRNGMSPEDRKNSLFKKMLFHKLMEKTPDVLNKVVAIYGDVSQDNLGMCEKVYNRITKEVTIVFHSAACVSFFRPISFLIFQNVVGTSNVIDLCKKLDKLEALVYTSTFFSNANQPNEMKEMIYKLPFKAEEAIRLARSNDTETLLKYYSEWTKDFQNYYLFSKCISENLVLEKAHNLPVSIVRPSIIINCMKDPLPAYIERGSAVVNLSEAMGKGFLRVLRLFNSKRIVEFVPVDIAANAHILAAFLQATKRVPSLSVYNCTSGAAKTTTWEENIRTVIEIATTYPLPDAYMNPSVTICTNPLWFKFLSLIYHLIPAAIFDMGMWIAGKEYRLVKLYKFAEKLYNSMECLLDRDYKSQIQNFRSLPQKLNETDKKIFYVDVAEFDFEKLKTQVLTGCPLYRVNNKIYEDNLKDKFLRYFFTYLYRTLHLIVIVAPLYLIFKLLYSVLS